MSMMIVTHEMRFARDIADRVLFIDKGAVIEEGPPDAVFGAPQNERTQRFLSRVLNI
jgi:ABC-type polar amino acid transport system ATPase subunit